VKVALVRPGNYSGTSFAVIDGKGRIAVPSSLRKNIPLHDEGGAKEAILWVGFDPDQPCLTAFGQDQYDRLDREIERRREEARDLKMPFDEQAEERKRFRWLEAFVLDSSGRFSPTAALRRRSGIEGPLAFIGAGKRFEIWSCAVAATDPNVDPDLREMAAEEQAKWEASRK
jgi:MraZ protein